MKLDGEPCTLRDYLDTIKYDRACAPLEHVFAIDLAIEISRLKYTSISSLYKMSVGGAKCRVYPEGVRFRVRMYCAWFPEESVEMPNSHRA